MTLEEFEFEETLMGLKGSPTRRLARITDGC
jgi:hypothetical protein